MMRTEKEIKKFLVKCNNARSFGMSIKSCPAEKGRKKGCCAECSLPTALMWVLEKDVKPSANGQDNLIAGLIGGQNETMRRSETRRQ